MRAASKPSPWLKTWKKPHGGSSASVPPVKPAPARSAAMTPFCAARPTCSGLVIVPKLTRMPEAQLAAMASACAMALGVEAEQLGRRGHRRRRCRRCPTSGSPSCSDWGWIASAILHSTSKPVRKASSTCAAAGMLALADGQRRGQRRHRGMREQAEDAIGAGRQLRVVPVERVPAGAVERVPPRRRSPRNGSGPNTVASARESVPRT